MKKTLGVGYLKVLLLATVIAILIVTTGYSYVNRGEIIFIDEVENGGTEDPLQANELNLSNSYELRAGKIRRIRLSKVCITVIRPKTFWLCGPKW